MKALQKKVQQRSKAHAYQYKQLSHWQARHEARDSGRSSAGLDLVAPAALGARGGAPSTSRPDPVYQPSADQWYGSGGAGSAPKPSCPGQAGAFQALQQYAGWSPENATSAPWVDQPGSGVRPSPFPGPGPSQGPPLPPALGGAPTAGPYSVTTAASDKYITGGMGTALDPSVKRIAAETYWALRRASPSVCLYMTNHYKGARTGREFEDLYMAAEIVDAEVDRAYRLGGMPGVDLVLQTSDTLEFALGRIGNQISWLIHKDPRMYEEMRISRLPGSTDVLPQWRLAEGREAAKQGYLQDGRVSGKGRGRGYGDDDEGDGGARRRNRGRGKTDATGTGGADAKGGRGRGAGRGGAQPNP